eukprot:m.100160 g.100160  ORF g.100160 m.100160 type:complete len:61 (+) comp14050_c0_seq7:2878-3060(+)
MKNPEQDNELFSLDSLLQLAEGASCCLWTKTNTILIQADKDKEIGALATEQLRAFHQDRK